MIVNAHRKALSIQFLPAEIAAEEGQQERHATARNGVFNILCANARITFSPAKVKLIAVAIGQDEVAGDKALLRYHLRIALTTLLIPKQRED